MGCSLKCRVKPFISCDAPSRSHGPNFIQLVFLTLGFYMKSQTLFSDWPRFKGHKVANRWKCRSQIGRNSFNISIQNRSVYDRRYFFNLTFRAGKIAQWEKDLPCDYKTGFQTCSTHIQAGEVWWSIYDPSKHGRCRQDPCSKPPA